MAVGYLEQDWQADKVCTTERGKNFIFATENFTRNNGKVVAIGFFFDPRAAFVLHSEDLGDFFAMDDLWKFFKREIVQGDESQFLAFEDDYEEVVDEFGDYTEFFEEGLDLTEEEKDRARLFYDDVAKRYWQD